MQPHSLIVVVSPSQLLHVAFWPVSTKWPSPTLLWPDLSQLLVPPLGPTTTKSTYLQDLAIREAAREADPDPHLWVVSRSYLDVPNPGCIVSDPDHPSGVDPIDLGVPAP